MKRSIEDIKNLYYIYTGNYNMFNSKKYKTLDSYLEAYTKGDIREIDKIVEIEIEKEIKLLKDESKVKNNELNLNSYEFNIYRLKMVKEAVRVIVEINEKSKKSDLNSTGFPNKLVKILKTKGDKESIIDYYNKLIYKWHLSHNDEGSLKYYMGLSKEAYELFFNDTNKFVEHIKNEFDKFNNNK